MILCNCINVHYTNITAKLKKVSILWKTLHMLADWGLLYALFYVIRIFVLESLSAFCHTYAYA